VSLEARHPFTPPVRWRRFLFAPAKLLLGMALTQSIVGAMIVIGWAQSFMQRTAMANWWKRRLPQEHGTSFSNFIGGDEATRGHLHWPNWLLRQNFIHDATREGDGRGWRIFTGLSESLRRNFWFGLQGILNTSVLVLPAGVLMWFGWDYGWNQSFYKGYEQFYVGVSVSVAGVITFIAAMFYVPLAQARQATTGQWRTFFDFRLVWIIARQQWVPCLGLAFLYLLLGFIVNALKTAPNFLVGHGFEVADQAAGADPKGFLEKYFYWSALVGLPAFVLVRWVAARIYAAGVLRALHEFALQPADLAPAEQAALGRLGLLSAPPLLPESRLKKLIKWFSTRLGRALGGIVMFLIWVGFVTQVYFAEFLMYHEAGRAWLNHPLVQLPWFQYLPSSLKNSGDELLGAAGLVLLCALFRGLILFGRSLRAS